MQSMLFLGRSWTPAQPALAGRWSVSISWRPVAHAWLARKLLREDAMSRLPSVDRAVERVHAWVFELDEDLGWGDPAAAFDGLCSTLRALRDQLSTDEVLDLASQLPVLLRGFFLDGWNGRAPRVFRRENFVRPVARALGPRGEDAEHVARASLALLARHVAQSEMADLVCALPPDLGELFPEDIRRLAFARHGREL
jgi:uncharacterized protein (DUF2267 family)